MKYTRNDMGRLVIAVGAEGSEARLEVEYPFLIDLIRLLPDNVPEATKKIVFDNEKTPMQYRGLIWEISRKLNRGT